MRIIPIAAAALAVTALAGCKATGDAGGSLATPPAGKTSNTATAEANTPPDPKAKLTGSCDYELGDGMGGNYSLNAEVDVKNTGNIGLLVNVKVSWPQFGTSPVVASKKVKVPYRKTVTVRFKKHASMTQITRIQNWQERHDFDDGCKYKGDLIETSGQPH